ncbi:MAG: SDR family NAD(P)-dependent oxidoreductase, partial [Aeromicrobium sp.]
MSRLEGRTAIVTGASANIGGALAAGLASEGARVVCTDIVESVAQATARVIVEAGGEAIAMGGDVTDTTHALEVVRAAMERWGRVDILVNNAMEFNHKGLLTMPVEEFRRQVDICLTGALVFTKAV